MEPKFQTSFIPKRPINSPGGSGIDIIHNTNIFSVIATVVFIVTILTSGSLFLYKYSLTNQIKVADQNIITARDAFEPEKIRELIDANTRIISARSLLENHVVMSKILILMESLTIKKMRFTEFNYTNKNNNPTITILGEIQTYNALAEQQDVFLKNEFVKNPTFSNFNLGDNGYILVNFSANIDPGLISYKKFVESTF
ncbi:MAG: hypothetical protein WCW47_03545 [Candidatus Paceibacterota bacterium]|jgi:hypothetical protein